MIISLCVSSGICFHCVINVVPVKNEDGLVIMFILNFELPNDTRSSSSSPSRELNRMMRIPWLSVGKHFYLKMFFNESYHFFKKKLEINKLIPIIRNVTHFAVICTSLKKQSLHLFTAFSLSSSETASPCPPELFQIEDRHRTTAQRAEFLD